MNTTKAFNEYKEISDQKTNKQNLLKYLGFDNDEQLINWIHDPDHCWTNPGVNYLFHYEFPKQFINGDDVWFFDFMSEYFPDQLTVLNQK